MDIIKDFTTSTIELQDDYEGKTIATLIRANANTLKNKNVLYLHGFVDYFFQADMAKHFLQERYNFFAIDLRKYGRSILPHQHENYCKDMHEYYEEITKAIEEIASFNKEDIYLFGHSTGGLLATNYMIDGEKRSQIKALILNSPFFNLKIPSYLKTPLYLLTQTLSFFSPYSKLDKALSPAYAQSIHKDYHGEWDFNLAYKPIEGFPAYFAWSVAIIQAQKSLQGADIRVPIIVMHSSSSKDITTYTKEAQTSDIVLNIEDIKSIGRKLGSDVTLISIQDALHDIFLSKKVVRERAFRELFTWLQKH